MGVPRCSALKKFRINVRAALGSELGRNGSRRNGISRPIFRGVNECQYHARQAELELRQGMSINKMERMNVPRFFISCVHPRSSSCTSSGATSVRVYASVHGGLAGASSAVVFFAAFLLLELDSLPRKTREKKGIFDSNFLSCSESIGMAAHVKAGSFVLSCVVDEWMMVRLMSSTRHDQWDGWVDATNEMNVCQSIK